MREEEDERENNLYFVMIFSCQYIYFIDRVKFARTKEPF